MPYSCRKVWSWAQAARWRVLLHKRSEGISSIQLFESSRYWGLWEQRAVSRVPDGQTGASPRHLAPEGQGLVPGILALRRCEGSKRPRAQRTHCPLRSWVDPSRPMIKYSFPGSKRRRQEARTRKFRV